MDYYSIDIEASGPVPGRFSLLSLGATHVRRQGSGYVADEDFYVELAPSFSEVSASAMQVNGLDLDELARTGRSAADAMAQLVDFVARTKRLLDERPIFVAHNAPFDWMFVAYYFEHVGLPNPFGHSALDTKALAMGVLGLGWAETSLKQLARHLPEVPARDAKLIHHAGADARFQAEVFAALMTRHRAARRRISNA